MRPSRRGVPATPVPREASLPVPAAPPKPDVLAAAFLLGYRQPTRSAYTTDLRSFFAWCQALGVSVLQASRAHVDLYARHLETAGMAPATVARRLSTLSGFYRYAVEEGRLERSPAAHVRRPQLDRDHSTTLGLERDEALRFLDAGEEASPRDHVLACLLLLNGLRVSEACGANVRDLGETRGHRVLRIKGKGHRIDPIALAPRTSAAIQEYLAGRDSGPLLLKSDGARLTRHAATRIVERLARRAGITKRISPHSCRHAAVTLLLDGGGTLRDAQDFARHADPRTTRRYDRARGSLDRHGTYTLAKYLSE